MNEKPGKSAEQVTETKKKLSILKWLFLLAAVFFSFASLVVQRDFVGAMSGNSAGAAAAGLWIAFAMLHIHETKSSSETKPGPR